MALKLTEGAIKTIMQGGDVDKPVLQVLGNKRIGSVGTNERYRLLLSDGCNLNSFAMLATQLNDLLASGDLSDYSIIQINRYITSLVDSSQKRIMIILDLTVLTPGSQIGLKLGNPVLLTDNSTTGERKATDLSQTALASTSISTVPASTNSFTFNSSPKKNEPAQHTSQSPINTTSTLPISSLNPYQNKWVIRARVANKTPIRTWSNARGEGKLFSFDLIDESGEIRATAFNEQCDMFFDVIEVDQVYFISRCFLKTANKKFTSLKNDYEMSLGRDTQIILCNDGDAAHIPKLSFHFTKLQDLENLPADEVVDIIGICKSAMDVQTLIARTTNRELKKRDVLIVDTSNTGVNVSLWGTQAENFNENSNKILAIKGGKLNEFGGFKSVSVQMSSQLILDPDIPEAHQLRRWFNSGGAQEVTRCISKTDSIGSSDPWMTLHEARAKQLGCGEKAGYFQCKAVLTYVRSENSIYKACPQENCNKKVIDQHNGMYRCEKCNRESPEFKYRLLASTSLADWSGKQWVTSFQDTAEVLLGTSASKLGELVDNPEEFTKFFRDAAFKTFNLKLRCKMEMFNDETRMKTVVVSAASVNYKEYNRVLISKIKKQADVSMN